MGAINISHDDKFNTDVAVDIYDQDFINKLIGKRSLFDVVGIDGINITWNLDLHIKSWGVKNLAVIVPDQATTLKIKYFDEEGNKYVEVSKNIFLANIEVQYLDISLNESIFPSELIRKDEKWVLVF